MFDEDNEKRTKKGYFDAPFKDWVDANNSCQKFRVPECFSPKNFTNTMSSRLEEVKYINWRFCEEVGDA